MSSDYIIKKVEKNQPIPAEEAGLPVRFNDKAIENAFDDLINIDDRDIVRVNTCKLCNHPMRFEIEQYWNDHRRNSTQTARWVNDNIDDDEEEFSVFTIRNHMKKHYFQQERQIRLREYSNRIKPLMNLKQDQAEMLRFAMAVSMENLSNIATMETNEDDRKEKTRSEGINKVVSNIVALTAAMAKIESDISQRDILQQQIINVWVETINEEESNEKKKVLLKVLEKFKEKAVVVDADAEVI